MSCIYQADAAGWICAVFTKCTSLLIANAFKGGSHKYQEEKLKGFDCTPLDMCAQVMLFATLSFEGKFYEKEV